LKPGAEKQMLTLFFSDIANFTSLSEGLDSDALAKLMNEYFEVAVSLCIHKTDGTVVKYIGDAIFAFWNAPELQPDHQLRACEAALRFRERGTHLIDGKTLCTRIGLHTGVANVGNFGSLERVDYTALGESVNLASRLEGLNKYLDTDCLLSGSTKEGLGDRLVTRALGLFQLKGFEKPVEVHELVGWPEQAEATCPWRTAFAEALNHFRKGKLTEAAEGFRRTLKLRPTDGPAKFYLTRLEEFRNQSLPEDWSGEIELKEK
jgi:adenylate cyclase